MLRSFRFANHKSFRDEAELLLMPAYDKSRPVVPVAGVFGANASGKSNLVDALHWVQVAVLTSHWQWEPGGGVPRAPGRLWAGYHEAPSHYTVELLISGVRYVYGFEVDSLRVREEWLYAYPRNRKRIVFEREVGGGWRFGTHVPRDEAEVLRKLTRDNVLFLGVAAHTGLAAVLATYLWFQDQLEVHLPDAEVDEGEVVSWLERSPGDREALVQLLQAADLGITDIRHTRASRTAAPSRGESAAATAEELIFVQGPEHAELPIHAQSRGTLVWLGMLTTVLAALESGAVVCVDEIDASLHPHLTSRLINLFRDRATNPAGAQLIFTTHDATLLDDQVLSRDEIWFVEKDRADGASKLYPLTDFHPRKNEDTEGRYLAGGYGAVPVLTGVRFRDALQAGLRARAAA